MLRRWRNAAAALIAASKSYHTIQAIPRESTGPRVAARERAQGRIPAVVFAQPQLQINPSGKNDAVTRWVSRKRLLTTERKQIVSIMKELVEPEVFCSTVFKLQVRAGAGSKVLLDSSNVVPIKVHRDKVTGNVLNLVFAWADEGTELAVDVPIVFEGEESCPGLKKGGHLIRTRNSLKFLCPAERIPPKIEVDISNLDIGDKLLLHDIKFDPSLKLLSKNEKKSVCRIVATSPESSEATTPDGSESIEA
ncbi:Large ribosomal subunit protein bL25-like protein [Drosera capensis]